MRAGRAEQATRVEARLVDIDDAVAALRRELRSERHGPTRDVPKGGSG